MLELVTTGQFRKDYKRVKKRGYDIRLLEQTIDMLLNEIPLEIRFYDHELSGTYAGFRECHILPDWLLIYTVSRKELILTTIRTGTHADLFSR